MKLSALRIGLCISLLVHGAIFSIVSLARSEHENIIPKNEDEITLQIESLPESVFPVVSEKSPVTAEPRTTTIESIPDEPMASPPTETQKFVVSEVIPIAATSVGELASGNTPQVLSALVAPAGARTTNFPSQLFPALAGESKGSVAGYLKNPQPLYPKESLNRKQDGLVILSVVVAREGKPQLVELLQSSGHALLDEAAIRAVKQWRFAPARIGNTQIISRVEVPIRFKLSNFRQY